MDILIIAEIGINHMGNMDLLREMVFLARDCGANIAKTQLYDPVKLFPDKKIMVNEKNWYQEVEKTKLTKEQLFHFAEWCREVEIEPMASAFDLERLGWLEDVGVKRHKATHRNYHLLGDIVRTGKEVFISVPYGEIFLLERIALEQHIAYKEMGNAKLLYCIPEYPTELNRTRLGSVNWDYYSGFSDHTQGIEASMVAMSRGAQIIEKHFTLDRNLPGPDQICSMEPHELKQLVKFARKVEEVL